MSVFTEQKDLEAVIKKIKKQPYVDRKNIFLFGTSMGGMVSAITAAEHKKEIRGLLLFYPAFVLVDDAKKLYAHEDEIPEKSFYLWMDVGKTYFKDLLNYDAYAKTKKYKRKVLIVHGDEDDIVPLSYSRKARRRDAVYLPAALLHRRTTIHNQSFFRIFRLFWLFRVLRLFQLSGNSFYRYGAGSADTVTVTVQEAFFPEPSAAVTLFFAVPAETARITPFLLTVATLGLLLAQQEQQQNARPAIKNEIPNFSQYDTVYVGYPIWLAYHNLIQ